MEIHEEISDLWDKQKYVQIEYVFVLGVRASPQRSEMDKQEEEEEEEEKTMHA